MEVGIANGEIRMPKKGRRPKHEGRYWLDLWCVRYYLTFMKTIISTKGQIVLPAELREQDSIEPGQEFDIERIERGEYRLLRRQPRPNEGLVNWLLACPEKDYFTPIESESTDTL
jgi:AbrB family looped-hinge helix DNA binding protein